MSPSGNPVQQVKVLVIGAGFGGLATLGHLLRAGETEVLAVEKASEVGGTWRDNTYPGCACDVPSHLYSLSFAPNPDWPRTFSRQPEIQQYLRDVARDHGLLQHIRLDTEVLDATWDDGAQRWKVATTTGDVEAQVLVDTAGGLAEPSLPDIPGLDRFEGRLFHSARWPDDLDLRGRRVVVVGTGASAIQIVPAIVPDVDRLLVVQRTAPWVTPRTDRPTFALERRLYAAVPALQRALRRFQFEYREAVLFRVMSTRAVRRAVQAAAGAHLRRQVRDPGLRARLTPDFEIGCKRILISNDWYPALTQPHVDVTDGLREVRATSVVAADGREHDVDTIVVATGFDIIDPPIAQRITGREGRTLEEAWAGRPRSLHATTVDGFPNLFRLGAAGTVTGHTSHVGQIEAQVTYLLAALQAMRAHGTASIEPLPAAVEADMAQRRQDLSGMVWAVGGCRSWYQDEDGLATVNWPRSARRFHRELAAFDADAYALRPDPGADAGEPLVLISGIGATAAAWEPVLPALRAAGVTPVTIELPGHGAAPRNGAVDLAGLVDHVEAELDARGLERPHVAGSSAGGWLALELARRGRAASVVALAPAGLWSTGQARFAKLSIESSARLVRALDPVVPAVMATPAGRTAMLSQFIGRPWRLTPQAATHAARTLAHAGGVGPAVDALAPARLEPLSADVPITVAWGRRDLLLGPLRRERVAELLPGARIVVLDGCGHLPMTDDPDRVAQLLLDTGVGTAARAA